jgi:ABC-2 type transport system permease protein
MRHDLRLLMADRALVLVIGLFSLLIGYAIYNGARWVQARQQAAHAQIRESEEKLRTLQDELAAREAAHAPPKKLPSFADKPYNKSYNAAVSPHPLAALSIGQGDLQGFHANIGLNTPPYTLFGGSLMDYYEIDNPTNLLAGRFDLAFVIVFVLPLLVFALSYNLLSAEREQGTLALTLAQPVSLNTFVMGKLLLRLAITLALGVGVSLVAILLSGIAKGGGVAPRLVLWVMAVALYASFWFAVAVLVGAQGYSSATTALALAGVWLVLVVVLPAFLNLIVNAVYPAPSRLEHIGKVRAIEDETVRLSNRLLAQYYDDHPELAPEGERDMNNFVLRGYVMRQERQRRIMPEVDRYNEQLARQQTVVNSSRFLSPAIALQETLNAVSGTDRRRHNFFVAQVHKFFEHWVAYFLPRVIKKATLSARDYDQIPRFIFQEEPASLVAKRAAVGLAALFIPTALSLFFALNSLRRYPLVG